MTNAILLISEERDRQIDAEHWTPEHDDQNIHGELAIVASQYALPAHLRKLMNIPSVISRGLQVWLPLLWPSGWSEEWWKPSRSNEPEDRIRELVKAGALIAAEIDRLERKIALARIAAEH